ncbi:MULTISPECIES: FecCD family ABC transporter permease [Pelosinus]|uniref:ABC-type transporter, integral membrane subunit n=1 Tax=Pelosinus fermentans B4 TaxID=1149862 RepID=I9ARF6_9FIRM|nr:MULTISPECIES: iron ABC transporter permease [Pelosinus]EIW15532.1 ABC-type transporter, integral membrane subunit [Pelosinus fermentans B4]EIW26778.1 ABC-type transporter, integral membrane subunit [Pelosinus fermentans A11]
MHVKRYFPYMILLAAPALILLMAALSILYGAKEINVMTIQNAIFQFDPTNVDHQIIMSSRLPRAMGTMLIGCALAVSGALMQGITRNYLASPGIMGISDGSILAVTLSMILLPEASDLQRIIFSFAGSALGAGIVFGLGSILPNGLSPVRLAILGTIIGTFLSSFASALAIYFQISQDIGFWYHARLHQLQPEQVGLAIPFVVVGMLAALRIARSVTVLSLGEEVAVSLGQRTTVVKVLAAAAVMLLTGSAVALAGKIAFVGLIIPHIVRFLVGADYKWVIPCSGVLGAIFLALSDIVSRFLNYPFETPVGVITSLIGVPFFLYLARKKGGNKYA